MGTRLRGYDAAAQNSGAFGKSGNFFTRSCAGMTMHRSLLMSAGMRPKVIDDEPCNAIPANERLKKSI